MDETISKLDSATTPFSTGAKAFTFDAPRRKRVKPPKTKGAHAQPRVLPRSLRRNANKLLAKAPHVGGWVSAEAASHRGDLRTAGSRGGSVEAKA